MEIEHFKNSMEEPNYSSLDEIFDKANLNGTEKEVFLRHKKYCEYWLLRSKGLDHKSFNSGVPNFIQQLARVIRDLESGSVEGAKIQKIKDKR